MELREVKILGGIGAIFLLCFIIPVIGWILSIVGLILTAIAIKEISDKVNEKSIFSNYLTSIILYFVSGIMAIIGVVALIFRNVIKNFDKFHFDYWRGFDRFGIREFPQIKEFFTNLDGKIWIILIVLAVVWILMIVAGLFTKSSFDKIFEKLKIDNFKIAGLLIFIGSILVVLFCVGFILILIGIIFEIIGFFSLPEKFEEIITP